MAIKLLDNTARFEVFSAYDESIDGKSEAGDAAYQKYMNSLDPADLIKVEGAEAPTAFSVRCLTAKEGAVLQEKHYVVNPQTKQTTFRYGYTSYLIEAFELACLGIKKADGSVQKVSTDDVGLLNAMSVGSMIVFMTSVGKNLKNA